MFVPCCFVPGRLREEGGDLLEGVSIIGGEDVRWGERFETYICPKPEVVEGCDIGAYDMPEILCHLRRDRQCCHMVFDVGKGRGAHKAAIHVIEQGRVEARAVLRK